MRMRRLRPVTQRPRITVNDTINHTMNHTINDTDGAATLAQWLTEAQRTRSDPVGRRIWRIDDSPEYATLWYAARDAGENMRARAVASLYANWREPGGRFPDPRLPASFSELAIAKAAAKICQLHVWQLPTPSVPLDQLKGRDPSSPASPASPASAPRHEPIAWVMTYPPDPDGTPVQPRLALHAITPDVPLARIVFDMACMIGYLTKSQFRILDPSAPHGVILLPKNPPMTSLMHQFAIALLNLDPACPDTWNCQCNFVRGRYNAPPPAHEQPTDTLNLADLRAHIPRVTPPLQPND